MIIGIQSKIPYLKFALHLMPVALIGLGITYAVILIVYRGALVVPGLQENGSANGYRDRIPTHRPFRQLLIRSTVVAAITVVLFFTGLPIALVATGAAAFLLLTRLNPKRIYREVDWGLLLMFVGLFIVVHAFQLHVVSQWHVERWTFITNHPVGLLSVASAALSNLVSNVPAVLLFEPIMHAMPAASQQTGWLALAMSSTFAGNLTILGSVANLIVVENARHEGVNVSFWAYCKAGIPITLLTLALGIAWLMFAPY